MRASISRIKVVPRKIFRPYLFEGRFFYKKDIMRNKYKLPNIELEDIILREIELKDYRDMFEYGCDPEVVFRLSWGPYEHMNEPKRTIRSKFLKRPKNGLPIGYSIVFKETNKMIGTIDYHTIRGHKTVEVGYVINSKYWNKGIVTRALNKVIEVGFEILDYEKLIIKHSASNHASQKVIRKNHFIYSHTIEREFYNRLYKNFEDVLCYEMTRSEYDDIKSKRNE